MRAAIVSKCVRHLLASGHLFVYRIWSLSRSTDASRRQFIQDTIDASPAFLGGTHPAVFPEVWKPPVEQLLVKGPPPSDFMLPKEIAAAELVAREQARLKAIAALGPPGLVRLAAGLDHVTQSETASTAALALLESAPIGKRVYGKGGLYESASTATLRGSASTVSLFSSASTASLGAVPVTTGVQFASK